MYDFLWAYSAWNKLFYSSRKEESMKELEKTAAEIQR